MPRFQLQLVGVLVLRSVNCTTIGEQLLKSVLLLEKLATGACADAERAVSRVIETIKINCRALIILLNYLKDTI